MCNSSVIDGKETNFCLFGIHVICSSSPLSLC
jgi:hypothetical protein